MIIELFRHGIRTEITFHESNPFPDHRYGVGDLIELGMKEHYLLGKKLR